MFLLGLLLAACAGAFAALLIAYNTSGGPEYTVSIFDTDMVTLNSLAIFCAGLALSLIFCVGLLMMGGKARMSRARRNRERRALDRATLERQSAAAREEAAQARERATQAEAHAEHTGPEPRAADQPTATWSADPADHPRTRTGPGGSHGPNWNDNK
ncbi:hypothetical protein OG948_06565 [Embleya sp. NBC_00888]|uniref:hypothetical protein n=1 Tax=Embleya sp. NBC_00888 TaxID=2975960 RepID=UPI003867686C|nr:hypothetical protein OG948_06565 [Embleya sp. NBC_00888]